MNLIKKINPNNLIGKTFEPNYSKPITIVLADFYEGYSNFKINKKYAPLTLVLLDVESAKKDVKRERQMKRFLKLIREDKDQFLFRLLHNHYNTKFNELSYCVLEVRNPIMDNNNYTILKNSSKPILEDIKKYSTENIFSYLNFNLNDIQILLMKCFSTFLDKEYISEIKNFYGKILEENIKAEKERLNQKLESLEYFSKELEDSKKEEIKENESFISAIDNGLLF